MNETEQKETVFTITMKNRNTHARITEYLKEWDRMLIQLHSLQKSMEVESK